ncbi:beta strand repeat-containing protein [Verrucomicrobium spinosum]|uniref:beta strand repeat-containing protein n=1 Tax=Verrucomicrobium spinosum TaxID=2736 RepID=UPI0012E0D224|nr:hypothetical protein [Verrucomicrobium spinosum]
MVPVSAATFDFSISASTSVTVGAVVAMNKVASGVSARVLDTDLQGSSVSVTATNTSSIDSEVTASSIAVSGSLSTGKSISIGFARSRNDINGFAEALVRDTAGAPSDLTATAGGITVEARDAASINALATATGISVAPSVGDSLTVAGAGTFATNNITTDTDAVIDNLLVNASGAIAVRTTNAATIDAKVAALAASVAISAGGAKSFAVGAVLAVNTVRGSTQADADERSRTRAAVLNSALTSASGGILVTSQSTGTINADLEAIAAAVAASAGNSTTFSLGGSLAFNDIQRDTSALISGGAKVEALGNGDLTVAATDSSAIHSTSVGMSAAANLSGGQATSISVGLAIASNEIRNDVSAIIRDVGLVTVADDLSVSALSTGVIDSTATAASLAASLSGGTGIAVSGAGALAQNEVLGGAVAAIDNSDVNAGGDAAVTARNTSVIEATIEAIALSASLSGGTGVGVGMGLSMARNYIGATEAGSDAPLDVIARITGSAVDAAGAVSLTAQSDQNIDAYVGAAAMAATLSGGTGVGVGAAGALSSNEVKTNVLAFASAGERLEGSSVAIVATDDSEIDAYTGAAALAAALSGGTGVAVSLAASVASNEITGNVRAYVNDVDDLFATHGEVVIAAHQRAAIHADVYSSSLAAGVSGGASISVSGGGASG